MITNQQACSHVTVCKCCGGPIQKRNAYVPWLCMTCALAVSDEDFDKLADKVKPTEDHDPFRP